MAALAATLTMFGKIDTIDAVLGGLFTLASLTTTGIYAGGTLQPGNISLGDSLYTFANTQITWAFVLSLVALGVAYATNRMDQRRGKNAMTVSTDLSEIAYMQASYETYIAGATVILVLLSGLNIVGFNGVIQSHWALGWSVTGIQIGGYYVFSYLG